MAVVAAIWLYGAIYVVYGEGLGISTCWKDGWSPRNTFVDYEQVLIEKLDVGWEGRELPVPWKVLDAIKDCTLVEDPKAWSRDQTIGLVLFTLLASGALLLLGKRKKSDPD
ncbi:MAG TPA: hypothetical protein VGG28_00335 [Kofleriaceae bacterium]